MSNKPNESPTTKEVNDEFDIPFDELKDLQWIGNGAQGCVFKGHFRNEEVAIKKVKSKDSSK